MEMKTKIDAVCEIFDTMLSCFKSEVSNGVMNVDAKEAGEVADIIKDMSETEKNLYEAHYYKLLSEAMEEKSKGDYRMGYKMSEKPYIDAYLYDPDFDDNMRYGYNRTGYNGSSSMGNSRMGYMDWEGSNDNEYGKSYGQYRDAKRHYTETKSSTDKEMMDRYANEHLDKTIATVKEMWADADPSRRTKMKTELSALVNSLNA